MKVLDVVIVGGGAAGFFCGCELLSTNPNLTVEIWEKSAKVLSKVRISGGGRCNVTHDLREVRNLIKKYPRGSKYLRQKFIEFGVNQTVDWFENKGVKLKVESDGRMFPVTDSSETIAQCLEQTFHKNGGKLRLKTTLEHFEFQDGLWNLTSSEGAEIQSKYLVFAIGGLTDVKAKWLQGQFPINITPIAPSIFTLNISDVKLHALSGVSVSHGRIKYEGIKSDYQGPVLITHWGLSGPAVLASSAYQALALKEKDYQTNVQVGWVSNKDEEVIRRELLENFEMNRNKSIRNAPALGLPKRLWDYLLERSGIGFEKVCADLKKDEKNRLLENILRSKYSVSGRTTYKEEFVTAGGIDLSELTHTGAFKSNTKVYAIGEMIDVDGITGGFNFQAAWTTAYCCAKDIALNI